MARITGLLFLLLATLVTPLGARAAPAGGTAGCDRTASPGGEELAGGWAAERLCGLGGDDVLSGATGNDHLHGGPGGDEVGLPVGFVAERGNDLLLGGDGTDRLTAGQGDDRADGGPGDDTLDLGFGDDELALGGPGIDRLHGGNGNDGTRVPGGGVLGGPDADLVAGGPGEDRMLGDGGAGAPGDDVLLGGGGGDAMDGGGEDDLLLGGKAGDALDGGPGHDVLVGNSGADVLIGGDGNDLLWATDFRSNSTEVQDPERPASPGDNVIDCGAGDDVVVIDLSDDRPQITGCEHVVVMRSARSSCARVADWIAASGNPVLQASSPFPEKPALPVDAQALRLCAAYATAFLRDPTDDNRPNLRGTAASDELASVGERRPRSSTGEAPASRPDGATIFHAKEGDDHVVGSPGPDSMMGGPGDDVLRGMAGDDGSLEGEDGDDRLLGGPGDDVLFGRTGEDLLWGEDGADYLEGGRGADGLAGGAGDDVLLGGWGRDKLGGGPGDDTFHAYDGVRDIVDCGAGNDVAEVDRYDVVRDCERVLRPPRARTARRGR